MVEGLLAQLDGLNGTLKVKSRAFRRTARSGFDEDNINESRIQRY